MKEQPHVERLNGPESKSLTFAALDGLAFSAARHRLGERKTSGILLVRELGPAMELFQLGAGGVLPKSDRVPGLSLDGVRNFYVAMKSSRRYWLADDHRLGFFKTNSDVPADETAWIGFRLHAQQAAEAVGFSKAIAQQFAGALGEMHSNIYEHSEASQTGVVAFRATAGAFEFVVADRGIGVLRSLTSCSEYALLKDHGDALQVALTDGGSRYGSEKGRGRGFRPLFVGLSNLKGSLRFRSGDHALTIDGSDPLHMPWKKATKPPVSGFLASISCMLDGAGWRRGVAH